MSELRDRVWSPLALVRRRRATAAAVRPDDAHDSDAALVVESLARVRAENEALVENVNRLRLEAARGRRVDTAPEEVLENAKREAARIIHEARHEVEDAAHRVTTLLELRESLLAELHAVMKTYGQLLARVEAGEELLLGPAGASSERTRPRAAGGSGALDR